MRQNIRDFVANASRTLPIRGPVYEYGSRAAECQLPEFADLRTFFHNLTYVGCDFQPGPGVDRVEDMLHISMPDESTPTIICVETLEHVTDPIRAVEEFYRVLDKDGILIITSEMDFPIHNHPNDYWRFTPEGFRYLIRQFMNQMVFAEGDQLKPDTVLAIASKGYMDFTNFVRGYNSILEWRQTLENQRAYAKKLAGERS